MAQDFTDLATTEAYASLLTHIGDRDVALALAFDPAYTTPTNIKTRTVRWNSVNGYWEYYTGSAWAALASTYNITAAKANNVVGGAAGSLLYQSGADTTANLALGTTNYVLMAGAGAPQWVAQSSLAVGTAANLAGTPTVPDGTAAATQAWGNNTTKLATTAYVDRLRQLPTSSSTTLAATDVGKCVHATGTTVIPNGVMAADDMVSIYNNSDADIALTASITTLYLAGTSLTGNRTLARRGLATIRFISGTVGVISGAGLS